MTLNFIFKRFPKFYSWCQSKKLQPTDLSILTEFKDISSIEPLIHWIEQHPASHSEGKQILELGGELILMDQDIQTLLHEHSLAKNLIKVLRQLRFPKHTIRKKQKEKIIKELQKDNSLKMTWREDKDKSALAVQFQSFSLKDLKQKVKQLEYIYTTLNKSKEKLWSDF